MIIDNPRPEHIPALRRLWQQAFADPEEYLDSFFETGFSYDRCFCVFREEQPVAAVYSFDCLWQQKPVAYLYALAVEKDHRGQGLSRLLLSDTHAKLQSAGYTGAILEPAEPWLWDYYGSMGYKAFGARRTITVCAENTPIAFQQLGQLAYQQKRAELLPAGGVEQPGVLTQLLMTQATLYGGEDFVAAVSRWSESIVEFLGNREKIPGLLAALSMDQAAVTLPGGRETAMYLDFAGQAHCPAYFGLPMD